MYYQSLLLLSGDVELNPGPNKICPMCKVAVPVRKKECPCGHVFVSKKGLSTKSDRAQKKSQAQQLQKVDQRKESSRIRKSNSTTLETYFYTFN